MALLRSSNERLFLHLKRRLSLRDIRGELILIPVVRKAAGKERILDLLLQLIDAARVTLADGRTDTFVSAASFSPRTLIVVRSWKRVLAQDRRWKPHPESATCDPLRIQHETSHGNHKIPQTMFTTQKQVTYPCMSSESHIHALSHLEYELHWHITLCTKRILWPL